MTLPPAFVQQMKAILAEEWNAFEAALSSPSPVSIRFHLQKQFITKENSEGVKWNANGVYLNERPSFTLDPHFHAGAYYVQEASSMFIQEAVKQLLPATPSRKVLDLCAAPGGKSTLLLDALSPNDLLLCNEVIKSRYHILNHNLAKWGQPNVASSQHDSKDFKKLSQFFDLVLVDAPCSGEGLFRKDPKAVSEWSPNAVQLCASRQKRILANAQELVKPGGLLFYSTCTYNEIENQQNATWLCEEFGFERCALSIPEDWGIVERDGGYQFYPHRTKGEGFFLACLRKLDESLIKRKDKKISFSNLQAVNKTLTPQIESWLSPNHQLKFFQNQVGQIFGVPTHLVEPFQQISKALPNVRFGLELGQLKRKDFIPAPALALSNKVNEALPTIELPKREALLFLKRSPIVLESIPSGWALVAYDGMNLGWVKGLNKRINNYHPKEWRILMEIPEEI